ncbi:MAG: valine--tRNA ligase, partial [Verrucomicrobia bacterium]|nr:valine--tRNA ligase [Cytophagales bacterium]
EQLKKLGASCDWDRTRFTMEETMSEAVTEIFVDLYNKGLIYKAARMINWDPVGKTALSDEEVIYKENNTRLVYLKYKLVDEEGYLTLATVRPETIMGDVAVCVNPEDERYKHLIGKKVLVPLVNRQVPILTDEGIDIAFGTGTLKVTPAHDLYDYQIGQKYNLPVIDTLNEDGTLSESCGIEKYIGKDRFVVRKMIVKDLEELGLVEKIEDYKNQVGTSERTGAVIEPRISMQWWLKMTEISKPAFENVMNDTIQFHPPKFKNMYKSWMENVQDWCISRQLWWGHRIPAWYDEQGNIFVMKSPLTSEGSPPAPEGGVKPESTSLLVSGSVPPSGVRGLRQDEDVLDTWFSAWLWPISVFDGFKDPDNEDIKYFYPTDALVTAPEIIFFWVARMIIAGYEYKKELPFKHVYFTGIVRDKQGRKMSKSLGNSPDPLELIKIYGADGVRSGMLFSSQAGNDLMFDEKLCEQGRNFSNKIFNAFRLIESWEVVEKPGENALPMAWFEAKFNQALAVIEDHFSKFRISDALLALYDLIWNDFCSWYLEMIKPEYQQPIDKQTYEVTLGIFDKLMRVLHPFMPFITEEKWQQLTERQTGDSICIAPYPESQPYNQEIIENGTQVQEVISQIRNLKNSQKLSPKKLVPLVIKTNRSALYQDFAPFIQKLAGVSEIDFTDEKIAGTLSFLVKSDEFFVKLEEALNVEAETEKAQKELDYCVGFVASVMEKLGNEKFVANAKPKIIAIERQKLADAEAKIKSLQERLETLKK